MTKPDSNNIGYFIKNTYAPLIADLPGTMNITLPTAEQIAFANGREFNQVNISQLNTWLSTTNYWTKTPLMSNSNYVWLISGYTQELYAYNSSFKYIGARPTITTLKTNLLENKRRNFMRPLKKYTKITVK